MPPFQEIFIDFLDTLTGHLVLTAYLMAVTDERAVRRRLKKFPPLLLSPVIATLAAAGWTSQYFIISALILAMCTLWVRWAWQFGFWQAFAATCMAGIFQVAGTTLSRILYETVPLDANFQFAAAAGVNLGVSILTALLLRRLGFGAWFRLLLEHEPAPRQTALLLFALETVMEVILRLTWGVLPQFLPFFYLLVAAMVVLMTALVVYLAQRLDTARKMQAQQDIIAQQRLYEQDLETIRREVRAFRHDYKNLLAGLSHQAGTGELEGLRRTLAALDTGFDLRLGEKIQASTQIGNLRIPEVRSLLLSKLTAMREKGVECRLEVLYPVTAVNMDIWDFVRCLGILTDNAMEAALDAGQPWVEIILLVQDGRAFLRVSNPFTNPVDPGKMWEDGWSTKGDGRGLGLASYQRILENCPHAAACTGWEGGIFVQELTVEGRP